MGIGTLIYEGIMLRKRGKIALFHFFLSLHHQNNPFENISIFYLPTPSSQKTILRYKNIGVAFAPLCTPKVTPTPWTKPTL
jgi:hypothetical protein